MRSSRPDQIITNLIKQFKSLRHLLNMSHEDLAQKSGVTRPAISHIEGGKRKPSLYMSLKIAEALGQELSDMLRKAEEQYKQK